MNILPDQPAPTPGEGDCWAELIEDAARTGDVPEHIIEAMIERRALGIERYGTPLQRGNGRNHLTDAIQELLDAAVYLWAAGRHEESVDVLRIVEPLISAPKESS